MATYHSTARQAATIARAANVGKLLIGHFSARYPDESILLQEAREIFPATTLATEYLKMGIH
jgi:ribonuclease Z